MKPVVGLLLLLLLTRRHMMMMMTVVISIGWMLAVVLMTIDDTLMMHGLDVVRKLAEVGERERAGGRTHLALEHVVLVSGVHVKEVLLEESQVVEELHLLAQNATIDLDAMGLLDVRHVGGVRQRRHVALHARVVHVLVRRVVHTIQIRRRRSVIRAHHV